MDRVKQQILKVQESVRNQRNFSYTKSTSGQQSSKGSLTVKNGLGEAASQVTVKMIMPPNDESVNHSKAMSQMDQYQNSSYDQRHQKAVSNIDENIQISTDPRDLEGLQIQSMQYHVHDNDLNKNISSQQQFMLQSQDFQQQYPTKSISNSVFSKNYRTSSLETGNETLMVTDPKNIAEEIRRSHKKYRQDILIQPMVQDKRVSEIQKNQRNAIINKNDMSFGLIPAYDEKQLQKEDNQQSQTENNKRQKQKSSRREYPDSRQIESNFQAQQQFKKSFREDEQTSNDKKMTQHIQEEQRYIPLDLDLSIHQQKQKSEEIRPLKRHRLRQQVVQNDINQNPQQDFEIKEPISILENEKKQRRDQQLKNAQISQRQEPQYNSPQPYRKLKPLMNNTNTIIGSQSIDRSIMGTQSNMKNHFQQDEYITLENNLINKREKQIPINHQSPPQNNNQLRKVNNLFDQQNPSDQYTQSTNFGGLRQNPIDQPNYQSQNQQAIEVQNFQETYEPQQYSKTNNYFNKKQSPQRFKGHFYSPQQEQRLQKQKLIMNTFLTPIVFISKDYHMKDQNSSGNQNGLRQMNAYDPRVQQNQNMDDIGGYNNQVQFLDSDFDSFAKQSMNIGEYRQSQLKNHQQYPPQQDYEQQNLQNQHVRRRNQQNNYNEEIEHENQYRRRVINNEQQHNQNQLRNSLERPIMNDYQPEKRNQNDNIKIQLDRGNQGVHLPHLGNRQDSIQERYQSTQNRIQPQRLIQNQHQRYNSINGQGQQIQQKQFNNNQINNPQHYLQQNQMYSPDQNDSFYNNQFYNQQQLSNQNGNNSTNRQRPNKFQDYQKQVYRQFKELIDKSVENKKSQNSNNNSPQGANDSIGTHNQSYELNKSIYEQEFEDEEQYPIQKSPDKKTPQNRLVNQRRFQQPQGQDQFANFGDDQNIGRLYQQNSQERIYGHNNSSQVFDTFQYEIPPMSLDQEIKILCKNMEYFLQTSSHKLDLTIRKLQLRHPIFKVLSQNAFNYIIENSFLFKLRPKQGAYKEGMKALRNIYFILYGSFVLEGAQVGKCEEEQRVGHTLGEEIIFSPQRSTGVIYRLESCVSKGEDDAGLLQINSEIILSMKDFRQKLGGGTSLQKDYQKLMGILKQNYLKKQSWRESQQSQ